MLKTIRAYGAQLTTFLLAAVPVLGCSTCPTCFPIYSAILSVFGLKLADYSRYLLPLMLTSMAYSLRSMYLDVATKEVPSHPFIGALISCTALLVFKYTLAYTVLSYIAMAGLLAATVLHNRYLEQSCMMPGCKERELKSSLPTTCAIIEPGATNPMSQYRIGNFNL